MPEQINRLHEALCKSLGLPPEITVSQWAERNRRLSPEGSAARGKWVNRPFQAEPMDCLSPSHPCQQVVLMCASQILKTEVLLNFLGFIIDVDPGPTLFIEPRADDAKALSKDRVAPMLRDTPCLKGRVADARSRDADNTTLHKSFVGGHVTFTGAISPSGLAMRPIRYVLADEVDRYPASAGGEGDPVSLARRRTDEFFWNKKIVLASTPTTKGASRIEKAYESSDQRRPYVPCPHCGEFQVLDFKRLEWPAGDPESAAYRCALCQEVVLHHQNAWMMSKGEWRAENPASKIPGFWLSQMYSTRRTWGDLASEFVEANKDPETLKVFVNTVLAELWEEKHEVKIDYKSLLTRAEKYAGYIPRGGAFLVCGVDVQDNRLELGVTAYGRGEERWSVDKRILLGDPGRSDVWDELDKILSEPYKTEDGIDLYIQATCIDSGGHHTDAVYKFTGPRFNRRVYAVKGRAGAYPIWPKKASRGKGGATLFMVGVDAAKDAIYSALKVAEPGPKYCHFGDSWGAEDFEQLTVERVHTRYHNGHAVREWRKPPNARNERLDIAGYELAALNSRYAAGVNLNVEADRLDRMIADKRAGAPMRVPVAPRTQIRLGGF